MPLRRELTGIQPESEGVDVLLQRLVEAAADDEELVAEDRRAEVAALDVGHGGQVAPPTSAWQVVRDLYGIDPLITKALHLAGGRFNRLKKTLENHLKNCSYLIMRHVSTTLRM